MRKLLLIFIVTLIGYSAFSQTFHKDYLDGVLIVKLVDATAIEEIPNVIEQPIFKSAIEGVSVQKCYQSFKGLSAKLDRYLRIEFSDFTQTSAIESRLKQLPMVESVEKYPLLSIDYVQPTDYDPNNQWHLEKVDAPGAWARQAGNPTITVAVVDNAIFSGHEDLNYNLQSNVREFLSDSIDSDGNGYVDDYQGFDVADMDNNTDPKLQLTYDLWAHGTMVSGIAAAHTNNLMGIAALGYGVKLLPVKATGDDDFPGFITHGYEGIVYAAQNGADIINTSWGGTVYSNFELNIVYEVYMQNILIVASAGNSSNNSRKYPAAFEYVLAVGSTDEDDRVSSFSNFGPWVDVMAPGEFIYSTTLSFGLFGPESNYQHGFGTSYSAPLVASLAGLVKSVNPLMSVDQLRGYISEGSDNIDNINPDFISQMGSGRINANRSVQAAGLTLLGIQEQLNKDKGWTLNLKESTAEIAHNFTGSTTIQVVDIQGRVYFSETTTKSQISVNVPIRGIYLISLENENFRGVKKIVR